MGAFLLRLVLEIAQCIYLLSLRHMELQLGPLTEMPQCACSQHSKTVMDNPSLPSSISPHYLPFKETLL